MSNYIAKFVTNRSGKSCKNRYSYLKKMHEPEIEHIFDEEKDDEIKSFQKK